MSSIQNDRFLVFSLGAEDYAIPLLRVKEVIGIPKVTPIPQSPSHILGLINLRGSIISLMDLSQKLNIKSKGKEESSVIICDLNGIYIGVVVDSINSVVTPKVDEISNTPPMENAKASQYVSAVYRRDKNLILFLDLEKLLSVEDWASMKQIQSAKTAA